MKETATISSMMRFLRNCEAGGFVKQGGVYSFIYRLLQREIRELIASTDRDGLAITSEDQ